MKFYELLNKYSNEQIIDSLNKNYDDIVNEAYLVTLNELKQLKHSEEKQDIKICVEFEKDDFDEDSEMTYLQCDGIGLDEEGNMTSWGIEFDRWEDWLAKDIDDKCLEELDELTILAGIIRELTYNGYTQSKVDDRRDDLVNRIKKVEENPENLVSLNIDEFINGNKS